MFLGRVAPPSVYGVEQGQPVHSSEDVDKWGDILWTCTNRQKKITDHQKN